MWDRPSVPLLDDFESPRYFELQSDLQESHDATSYDRSAR